MVNAIHLVQLTKKKVVIVHAKSSNHLTSFLLLPSRRCSYGDLNALLLVRSGSLRPMQTPLTHFHTQFLLLLIRFSS